jgi:mRNA interferase HigB
VRIVTEKRIVEYSNQHDNARASLQNFVARMNAAGFDNYAQLRSVFADADIVQAASGRNVIVFNIAGNHHRLIAAIHYNTKMVFVLDIMPHDIYDKDKRKERL